MTHGDLGSNSRVGYTDSLCSRRMNEVPLSDFFAVPLEERERQMKQGQHTESASLWMNDDSLITSSILPLQEQDAPVEEECMPPPEAKASNDFQQDCIRDAGMSVFDLHFILATAGLVLLMNVLSRMW
jgi:hypothetical protein